MRMRSLAICFLLNCVAASPSLYAQGLPVAARRTRAREGAAAGFIVGATATVIVTRSGGSTAVASMLNVTLKRFDVPDEVRRFPRGRFELITLDGLLIGRATHRGGRPRPSATGAYGS